MSREQKRWTAESGEGGDVECGDKKKVKKEEKGRKSEV
jgi:hypothetical protein